MQISIHAPVKGATGITGRIQTRNYISIHAPVKGATNDHFVRRGLNDISIHAPVKGATQPSVLQGVGKTDFNPRPREGSDSA